MRITKVAMGFRNFRIIQLLACSRNWPILIVLWLACSCSLAAEVGVEAWVQRYRNLGSADDRAYKVAADLHGNAIVAGQSGGPVGAKSLLVLKYSSDGLPLWTNRYNDPSNSTIEF